MRRWDYDYTVISSVGWNLSETPASAGGTVFGGVTALQAFKI